MEPLVETAHKKIIWRLSGIPEKNMTKKFVSDGMTDVQSSNSTPSPLFFKSRESWLASYCIL